MKPGHWESVSLTVLTCLGNLGVSQNTIHYWHLLCGHLSLGGRWALNQSSEAGLSPTVTCRLLTPWLSLLQGSSLPGPTWWRARGFWSGFYLSFKTTVVRFLLCLSETAGPSVSEVMPRGWLCGGCLSPEGPPFVLAELGTASLQGLCPVPLPVSSWLGRRLFWSKAAVLWKADSLSRVVLETMHFKPIKFDQTSPSLLCILNSLRLVLKKKFSLFCDNLCG